MGKIAILCGDHPVGWKFVNLFNDRYSDRLAFVEMERMNGIVQIRLKGRNIDAFDFTSEEATIDRLAEHGVTTVVLAWWPKIIKKINNLDGVTVINTHPSLLPYNRGKHGYYWAIVDGTPFGVTIHRVDAGVDTGDILWQREIKLTPLDTGGSVYKKMCEAMDALLLEHLDDIAHERFPYPVSQDESVATSHHSSEFELPPIRENELYDGYTLIQDCRARTFDNDWSGRRIEIDGKMYRVHLQLVEDESSQSA